VRRDEARCPAGQASQARHSGGAGAPPGSTMRPCQELADDLIVALPAFAKPASAGEGRPAFGLLERDVTGTGTKAIRRPSFERSPKRKRGPAVRQVTACGAPRGARRGPQGSRSHRFALFGAPSLRGPTSWVSLGTCKPRMLHTHRGDEGVRLHGRDAATSDPLSPCGRARAPSGAR
jgi:hypothetical protein